MKGNIHKLQEFILLVASPECNDWNSTTQSDLPVAQRLGTFETGRTREKQGKAQARRKPNCKSKNKPLEKTAGFTGITFCIQCTCKKFS